MTYIQESTNILLLDNEFTDDKIKTEHHEPPFQLWQDTGYSPQSKCIRLETVVLQTAEQMKIGFLLSLSCLLKF